MGATQKSSRIARIPAVTPGVLTTLLLLVLHFAGLPALAGSVGSPKPMPDMAVAAAATASSYRARGTNRRVV